MEMLLKDMQKTVQLGLPGFMLSLVMASILAGKKIEIRMDFVDMVNKAGEAIVRQNTTQADLQVVAKAIERDGYAILRASNEERLTTLIAAVCLLILRYRDRGIEIEENAYLVAFAIGDEAMEDSTLYGSKGHINAVADRLEKEARRLGYFSHLQLV